MEEASFDLAGLFRSVDRQRVERGLTWAALSRLVGVSASTIRRFETAADAEADGVLCLLGWLGIAPEDFVVDSVVEGSPLPAANDGVIRVDGSRTTIQRLVTAAQESGQTVASLTRWSAV